MDIHKSGKFLNSSIKIITVFMFVLPICFFLSSYYMDKLSPDVFVSVKIEGTPELKRITTQDQPILNQDAIKTWLMEGINEVFNWNSTDYKKVLKDSAYFFDEGFYKVFADSYLARITESLSSGVQFSSSIVQERPVLISTARINGVTFWKYYLKTSTLYKSEFKTIPVEHEVIATVKSEDPKIHNRGVVLVNLIIR